MSKYDKYDKLSSIQLTKVFKKRLADLRKNGDSYEDVIKELISKEKN